MSMNLGWQGKIYNEIWGEGGRSNTRKASRSCNLQIIPLHSKHELSTHKIVICRMLRKICLTHLHLWLYVSTTRDPVDIWILRRLLNGYPCHGISIRPRFIDSGISGQLIWGIYSRQIVHNIEHMACYRRHKEGIHEMISGMYSGKD